jgi:hypothetical protein
VFATDKHFLNDRTEVLHGMETANKGLKSQIAKSNEQSFKNLVGETCKNIETEAQRHFIFSMSERGDDLSQWRGYANEGNGFSIGFDAGQLRRMSMGTNAPFGFNRVSYSSTQFMHLISKLSIDFSKADLEDENVDNTASCFATAVDVASCYYKHTSFRYEREWRLVSYHDDEEILTRVSQERLTPYIQIPLCANDEQLPILEIGIGPAVKNPNTRSALEDLCRTVGISPKIYDAATPFVRY